MTSIDGRDQPTKLSEILKRVADGRLSVAEAENLIRRGPPRPARGSPPLVLGLIFFVIGSVLAAIGVGVGQSNWSFASTAHETDGTVIRMVASGKRGSSPVVRYEVDGKSFELQSSVSSSPPVYSVGDKVKVLYHPDEPHKGTIHSFLDQWFVPTLLAGLGSLFAVIGLAFCLAWLLARRRTAAATPPSV